jgi:hypothetical protein
MAVWHHANAFIRHKWVSTWKLLQCQGCYVSLKNSFIIYNDIMFLWEIFWFPIFNFPGSRKVRMRCCTSFSFGKITENWLHHCSQQDARTTYKGKPQNMALLWYIHSSQITNCELLNFLPRTVGKSPTELLPPSQNVRRPWFSLVTKLQLWVWFVLIICP